MHGGIPLRTEEINRIDRINRIKPGGISNNRLLILYILPIL
jgi:hypothetical protein